MELSKKEIITFKGNIVTLELISIDNMSSTHIEWYSNNEEVCYVKEFKSELSSTLYDRVLLVMIGVGNATVTATVSGKKYECNVKVREAAKASKNDVLNCYYADFHAHTSNNHKKSEFLKRTDSTPITVLNEVKCEGVFDAFTISDHADLVDDNEFFRVYKSVEAVETEEFVALPATESEVLAEEYDHHGYLHRNSGEVVTINAHGYGAVNDWEDYFSLVYKNPLAVCSFAHPQILGYAIQCIWNFSFSRKICSEMLEMFRMIEVGNGDDIKQNLIHERMYSVGLDCGLKLSPVSTSDWHGPNWGATSLRGRTVIYSPQKSKELFLDAIRNNRLYATENGKVKLWFTINEAAMGETLSSCNKYKFHVEISHFCKIDNIDKLFLLEVISDYGKTVKTIELLNRESATLDFEILSDTSRYYYLKITSVSGDRTWSSPVWTGRKTDSPPRKEFSGREIDKTKWKVIETGKGNKKENIILNGPENPWIGEDTKTEFVIDLGEEREICAVGIYPHTVSRVDENISEADIVASFVSDYEIFIGTEYDDFHLVSKDVVRCYGEEKIDVFYPEKARFVKIKVLSTAGSSQHKEKYKNAPVMIGEVYIYE